MKTCLEKEQRMRDPWIRLKIFPKHKLVSASLYLELRPPRHACN